MEELLGTSRKHEIGGEPCIPMLPTQYYQCHLNILPLSLWVPTYVKNSDTTVRGKEISSRWDNYYFKRKLKIFFVRHDDDWSSSSTPIE